MKPARLIALLLIGLLVGIPAAAQDGYPLPENLPAITAKNAAQVTEIAQVGGVLTGDLVWSPNGSILAAGTSAGVKLYDAANLTAAPHLISGAGKDVLFNPDGTILVSDGQLWNTKSSDAIASIGDADKRLFSPSGNILVTSKVEDGKTRVSLWNTAGKSLGVLNTDSALVFRGAVFNADDSQIAIKLTVSDSFYNGDPAVIQLWNVKPLKLVSNLIGRYEALGQVAFVADGRYLLVEDYSDASEGDPFNEFYLSNTSDGGIINIVENAFNLTISPDRSMVFYDAGGLNVLSLDSLETSEWEGWGYNIAFSPDGSLLATSDYTSETHARIAVWKVNGIQRPRIPVATFDNGTAFAISPDNRSIAMMSDGKIHIRDVLTTADKKVLHPQLPGGGYDVKLRFNDAGDRLLLDYGAIHQTWDVKNGTLLTNLNLGYNRLFNPGLTQTAYWSTGSVHVLNLESGTDSRLPVIEDYRGAVMAFNPAQDKAVFAGKDMQLYDLLTSEKTLTLPAQPRSATFSADGDHLLVWEPVPSNPDMRSLSLHDIQPPYDPNRSRTTLGITEWNNVYNQVYDTSADFVAWATWNEKGSIQHLYNLKSRSIAACWSLPDESVRSNTFTPDGKFLIIGSSTTPDKWDATAQLTAWNVATMTETDTTLDCTTAEPESVLTLKQNERGDLLGVVISPDGGELSLWLDFPGYGDGPVSHSYLVLRMSTAPFLTAGAQVTPDDLSPTSLENVYAPQYSPDGQYLLTALSRYDFTDDTVSVQLWKMNSDEPSVSINCTGAAAFSPKGDVLVSDDNGTLSLWDVNKLVAGDTQPLATLDTHTSGVQEVGFSADGTRIYARWYGGVIVYAVSHEG